MLLSFHWIQILQYYTHSFTIINCKGFLRINRIDYMIHFFYLNFVALKIDITILEFIQTIND